MTPPNIARTAREFLRVSVDGSGRERSHDEQHAENAAAAQGRYVLGAAYRETGSASRYARKVRDDFAKLLSDLEHDRFNAQVLMLWENSRGSRKVGEWVTLIELCEQRSVGIFVTTHGREYDPANPRDRRSLLEDAVDSEYESAKTSLRAKRARAADAAAGKPNGPANYGYVRRYDALTRKFVEQVPEPDEAKVIRELFDRLHKGHSLRSIEIDFEQRGIRTRRRFGKDGEPLDPKLFSAQHLRALAMTRAYCGEREHTPGKRGQRKPTPQTIYVKAVWPALVSKAKFLAVQRILTDPARVTIRPGRGKHLLSMIACCDVCGGPLAVKHAARPDIAYCCLDGGHVKVPYGDLNETAEGVMLAYLSREDNAEWRTAGDEENERLQAVRNEIAEIRAELGDLGDQVGRGALTATLAARAEPAILTRLRAAEAREQELYTPPALRGLIAPGADVARRWKKVPMSTKREVARILLSPEVLGELRIARSAIRRRPTPIEDRAVWRKA